MDPDPDPRKEIVVDPDMDPERGLKWIRIRPNAVDPSGSGSGSETLVKKMMNFLFENVAQAVLKYHDDTIYLPLFLIFS